MSCTGTTKRCARVKEVQAEFLKTSRWCSRTTDNSTGDDAHFLPGAEAYLAPVGAGSGRWETEAESQMSMEMRDGEPEMGRCALHG